MDNSKLLCALMPLFALIGTSTAGCQSRQDRAGEAFAEYQTASANGDLGAARRALLELVAADDTVADYWIELGKVHLQLSEHGAAYTAFERARELDRANASVLGVLTHLALRSGNLALAEQRARELELVAPEDPAVPLTHGYVALLRGSLEEATRQVNLLLATAPYDSAGKVLRARIFLQAGQPEQAISSLREQVQLQPSDQGSLRALLSIYELGENWTDAAWTARKLLEWRPKDQELRSQLIDFELKSGKREAASRVTLQSLISANAQEVDSLLAPWVASGAVQTLVEPVFEMARESSGERRIAFARFLSKANQPQMVIELTRDAATLPINASNTGANALYGFALGKIEDRSAGLERLSRVISFDSLNGDALRGRAELRSGAGAHKAAIEDAQKLVAADRGSSEARLLLARIYLASGDSDAARRTLWEAFQEIPADRSIYEALRVQVAKREGSQALQRLTTEFKDQRAVKITRSFA